MVNSMSSNPLSGFAALANSSQVLTICCSICKRTEAIYRQARTRPAAPYFTLPWPPMQTAHCNQALLRVGRWRNPTHGDSSNRRPVPKRIPAFANYV